MKDAGIQHKRGAEISVPGSSDGNTKIYPELHVDHKSMPHLKKHNVGDKGEMHIRYKVTGQRQYKSGEGDTSLEITHYEPAKRVKGKDEKDLDNESDKDEKDQPQAKQE